MGSFTEFITFSPDDELTPGQAADLLNASRSCLDRLLKQGDIPPGSGVVNAGCAAAAVY